MKTNKWIWMLMVVVLAGVLVIVLLAGSKKLEMTEQIPAGQIQYIEVFNDSWDLEMKESADNQIHVDVVGKQKDKKKLPVVITNKDHKLMIRQDKQIGGAFSAFAWGKEGTIRISIPQNTVKQVTLNNHDGDIDIGALAVRKLMIENQAGYIKCKEAQADVVNVFSKHGEVVVKPADEKGEMNIETETGDIGIAYEAEPTNLRVKVENAKGDTSVNLGGLSTTNETDKDVSGTIGAGESSLYVKSRSGTIEVK